MSTQRLRPNPALVFQILRAIQGFLFMSLIRKGLLPSILSCFIAKQTVNFSGSSWLGLFSRTADESWSFSLVELNENTFMEVTLVAKRNNQNAGPTFRREKIGDILSSYHVYNEQQVTDWARRPSKGSRAWCNANVVGWAYRFAYYRSFQ